MSDLDKYPGTPDSRRFAVVVFTLPSTGERWNWPVAAWDALDALCEILDRANIPWRVEFPVSVTRRPRFSLGGGRTFGG